MYAKDCYTGLKVGRLTLIKQISWVPRTVKVNGWLCRCDCGNLVKVRTNSIGSPTVSCGCYNREKASKGSKAYSQKGNPYYRLYRVWCALRERCDKLSSKDYANYGGRGIKYDPSWSKFENFLDWSIANGYDYHKTGVEQSLDRIDVNGDYSPSNCRWVDDCTQANNKRNNVLISYHGVTKTIRGWSDYFNLPFDLVRSRYKEGYIGDDLFRPKGSRSKKFQNKYLKKVDNK